MKKLDLSLLKDLQIQRDNEFAASSITPRAPKNDAREYHQFEDLGTMNNGTKVLIEKLRAELDAKTLERDSADTKFAHMSTVTVTAHKEQLQKIIQCLELDLARLNIYQSALEKVAPEESVLFVETYNNGKSQVTRYGIDVLSAENYVGRCPMQQPSAPKPATSGAKSVMSDQSHKDENLTKTLHPMEVVVINTALHSGNNTTLIDIFERNEDGSIKVISGNVQTHTVVLHRQDPLVLLIDPTNSEYSQHLSLGINKLLLNPIPGTILLAPDKKLEIYTPKQDETGKDAKQTRDCTDIATKIALQLELPGIPPLKVTPSKNPVEAWKSWLPLASISNRGIDKDLPGELTAPFEEGKQVVAMRIKQASDDGVRSKFIDLNNKIQGLLKLSEKLRGVEVDTKHIEERYKVLLSVPKDYNEYQSLLSGEGETLLKVYDELYGYVISLLGTQRNDLHSHMEEV